MTAPGVRSKATLEPLGMNYRQLALNNPHWSPVETTDMKDWFFKKGKRTAMKISSIRNLLFLRKEQSVSAFCTETVTNTNAPRPGSSASTNPAKSDTDGIATPFNPNPTSTSINTISSRPPQSLTGLNENDQVLLLRKQALIQQFYLCAGFESVKEWYSTEPNAEINPNTYSLPATLIFAQQEAGTAVCISSRGLILTCSRCIAPSKAEFDSTKDKDHWLLFFSGQIVSARCVAFDAACDLALLRIVSASPDPSNNLKPRNGYPGAEDSVAGTSIKDGETELPEQQHEFPAMALASSEPALESPLYCLGHTGPEHFDSAFPNNSVHSIVRLSRGKYHGFVEVTDQEHLHDSERGTGALQHDCWTTSGHIGAPLLNQETGELVGLHTFQDGGEGRMGKGVSLRTIQDFLREHDITC